LTVKSLQFNDTLQRIFIEFYLSLTWKDPCEKCLVRPCCSEKCEEVILFENFYFPHDSMKEKRWSAWFVLYSIVISILTVLYAFYKSI
jgi:hypothetical protein